MEAVYKAEFELIVFLIPSRTVSTVTFQFWNSPPSL